MPGQCRAASDLCMSAAQLQETADWHMGTVQVPSWLCRRRCCCCSCVRVAVHLVLNGRLVARVGEHLETSEEACRDTDGALGGCLFESIAFE